MSFFQVPKVIGNSSKTAKTTMLLKNVCHTYFGPLGLVETSVERELSGHYLMKS